MDNINKMRASGNKPAVASESDNLDAINEEFDKMLLRENGRLLESSYDYICDLSQKNIIVIIQWCMKSQTTI